MKTPRFIVLEPNDKVLFELDNEQILSAERTEVVNGEHSLTITSLQNLKKEQRILTRDENGKIREYVIVGVTDAHIGNQIEHTYYCIWSLQHDFEVNVVNKMPGVQTPVNATAAMQAALSGQARWTIGVVEPTTTTGASMYYMSGWEALGVVVANWGGEIDVEISVSDTTVTGRTINLLNHIGSVDPVRRFDYDWDVESIARTVSDAPYPCRIIPRGKGEETESGGYGRRITIASVNNGIEYLENPLALWDTLLSNNERPTAIVVLDNIETPEELKEYAEAHLEEYTSPQITYEVNLAMLDGAPISLGDVVSVVDTVPVTSYVQDNTAASLINPLAGMKVSARAMKIVTDELDNSISTVEIKTLSSTLSDQFDGLERQSDQLGESIRKLTDDLATTEWLTNLQLREGRLTQGVNLTPFFSYGKIDTNEYWYNGAAVTRLLTNATPTNSGWAHVTIPATSSTTSYYARLRIDALSDVVESGKNYTLMVELANITNQSLPTTGKLRQPTSTANDLLQIQGIQDFTSGAHYFDATVGSSEEQGMCLQLWTGTQGFEFDVRLSLYEGTYRGAYKPYIDQNGYISSNVATIVTAGTGWEIRAAQFERFGKLAQIRLQIVNVSGAAVSGNQTQIGTLALGKRPYMVTALQPYGAANVGMLPHITASGEIRINNCTLANNASVYVSGMYFIA